MFVLSLHSSFTLIMGRGVEQYTPKSIVVQHQTAPSMTRQCFSHCHGGWSGVGSEAKFGYLGALPLAFTLLPPLPKMSTKSCAFECVHNFVTAQSVALVLL